MWRIFRLLAEIISPARRTVSSLDGLSITLDPGTADPDVSALLADAKPVSVALAAWVREKAVSNLKVSDCLPEHLAVSEVEARLRDDLAVAEALAQPVATAHSGA